MCFFFSRMFFEDKVVTLFIDALSGLRMAVEFIEVLPLMDTNF